MIRIIMALTQWSPCMPHVVVLPLLLAALPLLFFLDPCRCEDAQNGAPSPIPILSTVQLQQNQPIINNAVTDPPPPPSAINLWNGAWMMQLPGLINMPNWALPTAPGATDGVGPPGIATLLSFPPLFADNNNNNILSSAFAPPALLAKRDEQQRRHLLEERAAGSGNNETESGNGTAAKRKTQQFVGIRARFNPPIFEETARLFYSVFNHEAQHIQIRPQKQCFAEGCFHLHTFRIAGFQRPRAITLKPLSPNFLLLNILSFDVDIESLLNGSVQLLLTAVPITGNFFANARQLSITALFDLQKDQHKVPYLRIASCELRSGTISTKVTNLGLLTDSINLKYKTEMLEKAKELITSTICETISDTIRERVNHVLRHLPRAISVSKILDSFTSYDHDDCPLPPVPLPNFALQLDGSPTQRFYSNQLTLSYSNDPQKKGSWNGRFWRQKQRWRRGLEVIDDETDGADKGTATVAEISKSLNNKTASGEKHPKEQQKSREIRQKEPPRKVEKITKEPINNNNNNNEKHNKTNNNNSNNTNTLAQTSSECAQNYVALLDFLDLQSLDQLFIELDFLDSSAGSDFFAVGLSGDIFLRAPLPVSLVGGHELAQLERARNANNNASSSSAADEDKSLLLEDNKIGDEQQQKLEQQQDNSKQFPSIRFPSIGYRKTLEIVFSDLSANLLLLQAHRAKLLKVRIGPNSSMFGKMLRTTCSPDEVCLSDSIPEAGEKYPNQQLEIEIEPVQPPRIKFTNGLATLNIIGAATFLLARNGQPIGRIPFTTSVELGLRTAKSEQNGNRTSDSKMAAGSNHTMAGSKLEVSLAIPKLDILEDVDFFELPASTLEGFRDAVRGAILKSAARALASGIPLDILERRLCPYGISQPGIQLLDNGLVLLNAELDAYVLLFEGGEGGGGGGQCSPTEF